MLSMSRICFWKYSASSESFRLSRMLSTLLPSFDRLFWFAEPLSSSRSWIVYALFMLWSYSGYSMSLLCDLDSCSPSDSSDEISLSPVCETLRLFFFFSRCSRFFFSSSSCSIRSFTAFSSFLKFLSSYRIFSASFNDSFSSKPCLFWRTI